jgi:hypothetical protein
LISCWNIWKRQEGGDAKTVPPPVGKRMGMGERTINTSSILLKLVAMADFFTF